ncbi:MAG TPA: hypothetical protein VM123_10310 [archaeon]|nr:hypothetical protein [archaeon]
MIKAVDERNFISRLFLFMIAGIFIARGIRFFLSTAFFIMEYGAQNSH